MAKTILITGANRGIGLELTRQAAARGDSVIATARRPGTCPDLEALVRGRAEVTIRGADVGDPVALEALAAEERQPIDLVVCNAAQYLGRGGIDDPDYTPEAWRDVLMTNVAGVFFTVRAFLPNLSRAQGPKVAVITSIMGATSRAPGGLLRLSRLEGGGDQSGVQPGRRACAARDRGRGLSSGLGAHRHGR